MRQIVELTLNNDVFCISGYWLFHCHFLYHHATGMSMVMQVGDPEDIPPVPRNFPRCGDYLPSEPASIADVSFRSTLFDAFILWVQNGSRMLYW